MIAIAEPALSLVSILNNYYDCPVRVGKSCVQS